MSKKHKKNRKFGFQAVGHFFRGFAAPKIDGPCGDCELYEYSTPAKPCGHWCYKKGYIEPAQIKDCTDHAKKTYSVHFGAAAPLGLQSAQSDAVKEFNDYKVGAERYQPLYNPENLPVDVDGDDYGGY